MRGLEEMITRVRNMLAWGKTRDEVFEELQAQGVNLELIHWSIKAAEFERQMSKNDNE